MSLLKYPLNRRTQARTHVHIRERARTKKIPSKTDSLGWLKFPYLVVFAGVAGCCSDDLGVAG